MFPLQLTPWEIDSPRRWLSWHARRPQHEFGARGCLEPCCLLLMCPHPTPGARACGACLPSANGPGRPTWGCRWAPDAVPLVSMLAIASSVARPPTLADLTYPAEIAASRRELRGLSLRCLSVAFGGRVRRASLPPTRGRREALTASSTWPWASCGIRAGQCDGCHCLPCRAVGLTGQTTPAPGLEPKRPLTFVLAPGLVGGTIAPALLCGLAGLALTAGPAPHGAVDRAAVLQQAHGLLTQTKSS